MIYISCPTCNFFIGSVTIEFETKKNDICNNPHLSEEDKSVEITKLINSLGLRRYCCKMRLMTAKDIVQDVLPTSN
jgi:DNA-directed RNA polymerase subunit N (RpoN/RPB10)